MKKTVSVFLILVFIILCSCGGANAPAPEQGTTAAPSSASGETSQTKNGGDPTKEQDRKIEELYSKIDELNSKLDELTEVSERLASLEELFGLEYENGEYVYINGQPPFKKDDGEISFHEEYDGTAVVEAYLSGNTSGLQGKDKEVYDMASSVLSGLITDGMSDYDKEIALHDWICANVEYDSENLAAIPAASRYSHLPYGVLKYRRAICVGYATTFKLFLDMLRIDNRLVHVNNSEGDEHCWNLVKIGSGWYHADTTWDSSIQEKTPYFYFNMTDDAAERCGFFKKRSDLPAADSIEYNYYRINGTELGGTDALSEMIRSLASGNDVKAHGFILNGSYEENSIRTIVRAALSRTGYNASVSHLCSANGQTVFAVCLKKA